MQKLIKLTCSNSFLKGWNDDENFHINFFVCNNTIRVDNFRGFFELVKFVGMNWVFEF